jgi:hypothetical protein
MLIKVMGPDYWPLPWYLRRFTRVGYWHEVTEEPDAPVIIATADLQPVIDGRLQRAYLSAYYGLRPDVVLVLYIKRPLWEAYLRTQATRDEP